MFKPNMKMNYSVHFINFNKLKSGIKYPARHGFTCLYDTNYSCDLCHIKLENFDHDRMSTF